MNKKLFTNIKGTTRCFYFISNSVISESDMNILHSLVSCFGRNPISVINPCGENYIEVGPRFEMETAESSITRDILKSIGINIERIESSYLYLNGEDIWKIHDEMTYQIYPKGFDISSFCKVLNTDPVLLICDSFEDFQKNPHKILENQGMLKEDVARYVPWYLENKRVPTETEIFQIVNANSEHSRHGFFGAKHNINSVLKEKTLFDLIKAPYKLHSKNITIAFHDNASAVFGGDVKRFQKESPEKMSNFDYFPNEIHLTLNAETHNFPTTVEPYQGATTGIGGMLRDSNCAGRGSNWGATFAGYAVDVLVFQNGYSIPGDFRIHNYPKTVTEGILKYLRGIQGVADYGNCAGVPNIAGYARQVSTVVDGRKFAYVKCILFAGGTGTISTKNLVKHKPAAGMIIAQVGGPTYRVGFGGGLASSGIQEDLNEVRDKNAVQRGNPEMGNRLRHAMEALAIVGVISIAHDQGAVGACNAVTESVEGVGGRIDIRGIVAGDPSLTPTELWGSEAQERNCIVFEKQHLSIVKKICIREGVNLEIQGEVEDSGMMIIEDSLNPDHPPVNLPMELLFCDSQQVILSDTILPIQGEYVSVGNYSLQELIRMTLQQVSVGHKGHIVYRKDHTVGGKTIQAQCIGPFDYPISNYGLSSVDDIGSIGQMISLGEKPLMTSLNPSRGARMSFAEAVLNASGVVYDNASNVTNWMWAAKRTGQNAAIYEACQAISECSLATKIPVIGGKDSLSMITKDAVGEEIYSPNTVVVSLSGRVSDISARVTPLLQHRGSSQIAVIDFSRGHSRISGSALSQALGNIGRPEDVPDISVTDLDNAKQLLEVLVGQKRISALHDTIGDGGLITALFEMSAASNIGMKLDFNQENIIPYLFAEEARVVVEYVSKDARFIQDACDEYNFKFQEIGTTKIEREVTLDNFGEIILSISLGEIRAQHMETNHQLTIEYIRGNGGKIELATSEYYYLSQDLDPKQHVLSFTPQQLSVTEREDNLFKVLIVRDRGSNGEVEMAHMFTMAGFESIDVEMSDLQDIDNLDVYSGMIFVGGFSSKDVIASAVGWASKIRHNKHVKNIFQSFFNREDTFVLGVCNGCQLMSYLMDMFIPELSNRSVQLIQNDSHVFESRTSRVLINDNPSILFTGMHGSILSITSAHGEGKFKFDPVAMDLFVSNGLIPIQYVNERHEVTTEYPCNPNGSPQGIAGLTSPCGRFTMMMPHPERSVQTFQIQDLGEYSYNLEVGPWLEMANNAYRWLKNKKLIK